MKLTLEYLQDNYYYWLGRLWWRSTHTPVGTKSEHNGKIYLKVNIKGEMHYVHRLIFWLEKGYLPEIVDHEDQNTLNNSIGNLRDISHSHNLLNAKVKSHNTSGVTGVRWNKRAKKWIARVSFRRKEYHLGCFDKFEDAVEVRQRKVDELFMEYSDA